ncbi:TIGR01621 family pseudouridine synthase [Thalassotalea sediminis]|uniref:TIGR01621 family pseudouridine synthase n=1 Tax=Thalassotalea sediminis TaxID=1759089 RepID=UPI002573DCE6|nr:TIGR01621 family pseudouridine synthase [Thalassotalea sediminis]
MLLPIVDNQQHFIVIDKPAGIGFHDEGDVLGVHSLLKKQLLLAELYPLHRLDKMTSGLLIFAKNKLTAQAFQRLFEQREIEKYYLAVSDKKPKKKQGLIIGDMQKSRRGMWKLLRSKDNPAVTQFFSYSLPEAVRLFIIKPHSGKTHQIRVALASIGSPILGDHYYAKSQADRGYLHAFALSFSYSGKQYRYRLLPTNGLYFLTSECLTKINEITPPWKLAWPTYKT